MRSRGAVEFGAMPGTQVEKARRWGVSPQLISKWQRGESLPHDLHRERISDGGGPEPEAWDEPFEVPPPPPPEDDGEQLAAPTAEDTAGVAAGLLAEIRKLQRELAAGGAAGLTIDQRVRLVDSLAGAADKLGKHTGVKLTTRQILASPLWAEVRDAIVSSLEPWPEAMRAVADSLEKLKVA
jgi:hypothetical protein